jgi:alpha-galactosidase
MFPHGLRALSDKIKSYDLMSGIRISPFIVDEESDVFIKHKDWILGMPNGRFVKAKKNSYVLDSENEEVRAYVREVIHTILFMWGFDIIKLDDLYVAGINCGNGKSRGEKMCSAMEFLRECCGGKLMYVDHTPLMPAFGVADYCAISCDAVSNKVPEAYAKRFYRESASVRNAAADIVFRRGLNKRAFLCAPCGISFDEKEFFFDENLNEAEQNVLTNIEGLFTSVLVFHDSAAAYDQKKKRRFKRTCDLSRAKDVSIERTTAGFIINYKLDGRAYVIKFR